MEAICFQTRISLLLPCKVTVEIDGFPRSSVI
jgi:hypothetical protein